MPSKASSILRHLPIPGVMHFFDAKYRNQQAQESGQQALDWLQQMDQSGMVPEHYKGVSNLVLGSKDPVGAANLKKYFYDPAEDAKFKKIWSSSLIEGADGDVYDPVTKERVLGIDTDSEIKRQTDAKVHDEQRGAYETLIEQLPDSPTKKMLKKFLSINDFDSINEEIPHLLNPRIMGEDALKEQKLKKEIESLNATINDKTSAVRRREVQNQISQLEIERLKNPGGSVARELGMKYIQDNREGVIGKEQSLSEYVEILKALQSGDLKTGPFDKYLTKWFAATYESQFLDRLAITASRGALKSWGEIRPTDPDQKLALQQSLGLDKHESFNVILIKNAIKNLEADMDFYMTQVDRFMPNFPEYRIPGYDERNEEKLHFNPATGNFGEPQ